MESTTMADVAYDVIKRDIVRCDLAPGQRVTELEIASRYGVGRGAVRIALTRLEQEGFVYVQPRQGYHIAPLSLKHVDDLFAARMVLETATTRLAVGHVDIDELMHHDALCLEHYRTNTPESVWEYLHENTQFHLTIARGSDNEILVEMIAGLFDKMERILHVAYLLGKHEGPVFVEEHGAIIQALVDGDTERAARAVESHVRVYTKPIYNALMLHRGLRASQFALNL